MIQAADTHDDRVPIAPAADEPQTNEGFDPKFKVTTLQVEFADVFVEPEGTETRSIPQVLEVTRLVYVYTKRITYNILVIFLSLLLAFAWGLTFAIIAFFTVWVFNPTVRVFYILIDFIGKFYSVAISLFLDPLNYSAGLVFSRCRHNFFFKPYPKALTDV